MGVPRRAAWHWMWIAPTGYCLLLQAASIGNDAFVAPFALAAIFFALRARESGRARDLFCSILSAALMTAIKATSLPLLLPWAIAILPSLKIFLQRPIATAMVCVLAVFSSFLPTAVLNSRFCGDWSGRVMEGDLPHGNLLVRLGVNTLFIAVSNLVPPIFPEANKWNAFVLRHTPARLRHRIQESFNTQPQPYELQVVEMQMEENAGFGFGCTLLLAASAIGAAASCRRRFFRFEFRSLDGLFQVGLVLSPWVATLALLSQAAVNDLARMIAPFYLLLPPLVLRSPCHEQLVKKTWWLTAAFFLFALAAGLLIISPARPLFPVSALLAKLQAGGSNSKLATRIEDVYSAYQDRNHAFAPALAVLPPQTRILGLISYDDPEASLWQPFGSRRIICLKPTDTSAWLKSRGVQYVLARSTAFGDRFPPFDAWKKRMNAVVIREIPLAIRART
ncbi:MAG: glycosyltransferase family 39 protein, partial [Limisphaerales bacterium]